MLKFMVNTFQLNWYLKIVIYTYSGRYDDEIWLVSGKMKMNRYFPAWSVVAIFSLLIPLAFSLSANAQPLEKNTARILSGDHLAALPGSTVDVSALDSTPFGIDLTGIVIVSSQDAVRSSVRTTGVSIRSENVHLTDPALMARLAPFVGRPLSQRLIGEVRDEITQYMRSKSRPLVAVIIPPQEVTSGSIQILVVPFIVGEKRVERVATGYETTSEDYVRDNVRIGTGDEVAADLLLADVNWLNLNPFRRVGIVFQPGADSGTTDLILRLTDEKPWQTYAGYSNTGTSATGLDRIVAGVVAVVGGDQQLSYQLKASPQTIYSDDQMFNFAADSAYLAHSVGYFVPLPWRHKLTVHGDYSRTRSDLVDPFVNDIETWQASFDYAIPVLHTNPTIDVFGGLNFKHQRSDLQFGGVSTGATLIDVLQAVFGARGEFSVGAHTTDFEIKGVVSPGGLTNNNSDAAFALASGVAGASAQYAYLAGNIAHYSELPAGFGVDIELAGQLASTSLPALEQFGIGGVASVRGYEVNERSGDSGMSVQAELRLPTFSLLQQSGVSDRTSVYAFVDYGLVHSHAAGTNQSLLGAGLGVDMNINNNVHATLAWGHAFLAGSVTAANSDRIHASVTASY